MITEHQDSREADFLLVIPCYYESNRLPHYFHQLLPLLAEAPYRTTLLIVDDGSSSEEQEKLKKFINPQKLGPLTVAPPLFLNENQGKGGAILSAWRQDDSSEWLAFVDADGATSAEEVRRVLDLIYRREDRHRAYFASRIRMLGRNVERRVTRHLAGRVFAGLASILLDKHIYDSQCGFKVVPRKMFRRVSPLIEEKGLCFDLELFMALQVHHFPLEEVPIDWADKAGGHVSIMAHGPKMLMTLFQIRQRCRLWKERLNLPESQATAG